MFWPPISVPKLAVFFHPLRERVLPGKLPTNGAIGHLCLIEAPRLVSKLLRLPDDSDGLSAT